MLEAYLDESGTHEDAPVLCVAACVAQADRWRSFQRIWRNDLNQAKLLDFHAKDRRTKKFHTRLAGLASRYSELLLTVTVNKADFEKYSVPRVRSEFGSAFATCFMGCVFRIASWAHENDTGRVAYFAESGHKNMPDVAKKFANILASEDTREQFLVSAFQLVGKSDNMLPMHVADLLSHEVMTKFNRLPLSPVINAFDKRGRLSMQHLPPGGILETSKLLEDGSRRLRWLKKRNRRKSHERM